MQGDWFYGVAANRIGPVSADELQRRARLGQVAPGTLVWSDGMPQWVRAGTLPFLYPPGTVIPPDDGGALNLLIPMGPQSGWSIAAGYCGLLGMLFAIPAPFGIVFGIMGLRDLKRHPGKRGKGRAITGIVLGSLVTLGIIAVIVLDAMGPRHHY